MDTGRKRRLEAYIARTAACIKMQGVRPNIVIDTIKELPIFEDETRSKLLLQGIDGTLFFIPVARPAQQLSDEELTQIEDAYHIATRTELGSLVHLWDASPLQEE